MATLVPTQSLTQRAHALQSQGETEHVSLIPVMVVFYAMLLPREVAFVAGGLAFYSDRIALIIALPWVFYKIFKGAIRFVLPDFLMVLSAFWMVVAFWVNYDLTTALTSGGSQALDATIGYFIARISFRNLTAIRRALILLAPGLAFIGIILALESLLHTPIIAPAAQAIFGRLPSFSRGADLLAGDNLERTTRLGLMRASGPFSHPIHAGVFMASFAAFYGMSGIRGWPRWAGGFAAICGIFSVSSAAFGALAINYLGMGFDWLQRRVRELSWPVAMAGFAVMIAIVQAITNIGAIGFIQRYVVLDTSTALYRNLIWQYGMQSVWKHPWFGIGFEDYQRPVWMVTPSVDAHWLVLAMRFGIVPSLALLVATVMAVIALAKSSKYVGITDQRFYRGIAISLFGFGMMMFTVTLWGSALTWFNLLLGTCVACAQRAYSLGYQPPVVADARRQKAQRAMRPDFGHNA